MHITMIDGHRYEMTMFGATQATDVFYLLWKVLFPSVGTLIDATSKPKGENDTPSILDMDLASSEGVKMLMVLTDRLKRDDLEFVINALRKQTHVGINGSEKTVPLSGVYEMHFSGRFGSLFKWIGWGIKVQFANFPDAFASLMQHAQAAMPQVESDQKA